jgi:hypothetical protein
MKTVIAAAVALCLSYVDANAQGYQESINLGSITLTLGMPQDAVMMLLEPQYSLRKLECESPDPCWSVATEAGAPVGMLTFNSNRRLSWALKFWELAQDQQKAFEFATKLYWSLKELTKGQSQMCKIDLDQKGGGPSLDVKSISIGCKGKRIDIDVTRRDQKAGFDGRAHAGASIEEILLRE